MLACCAMNELLFSIRMRASRCAAHISGAERIVTAEHLAALAADLTNRALQHSRGLPDEIRLTIEALPVTAVVRGRLPDITTVRVANLIEGRQAALNELASSGVTAEVAQRTIALLAGGAHPDGGALAGAVVIDADSGVRLDPDPRRGVRASRMDLCPATHVVLRELLASHGLDNDHVREALVLAAKVMAMPGYVAELCWSDDPDYSAGYVCSPHRGYVRFPHLKALGDPHGGRAFFVRGNFDFSAALSWLRGTPVLFDQVGVVHPDETWPT